MILQRLTCPKLELLMSMSSTLKRQSKDCPTNAHLPSALTARALAGYDVGNRATGRCLRRPPVSTSSAAGVGSSDGVKANILVSAGSPTSTNLASGVRTQMTYDLDSTNSSSVAIKIPVCTSTAANELQGEFLTTYKWHIEHYR